MSCNWVYPVWVAMGWVKWVGIAEPEKLYCIERVKCNGINCSQNHPTSSTTASKSS